MGFLQVCEGDLKQYDSAGELRRDALSVAQQISLLHLAKLSDGCMDSSTSTDAEGDEESDSCDSVCPSSPQQALAAARYLLASSPSLPSFSNSNAALPVLCTALSALYRCRRVVKWAFNMEASAVEALFELEEEKRFVSVDGNTAVSLHKQQQQPLLGGVPPLSASLSPMRSSSDSPPESEGDSHNKSSKRSARIRAKQRPHAPREMEVEWDCLWRDFDCDLLMRKSLITPQLLEKMVFIAKRVTLFLISSEIALFFEKLLNCFLCLCFRAIISLSKRCDWSIVRMYLPAALPKV